MVTARTCLRSVKTLSDAEEFCLRSGFVVIDLPKWSEGDDYSIHEQVNQQRDYLVNADKTTRQNVQKRCRYNKGIEGI